MKTRLSALAGIALSTVVLTLSGCKAVVLHPAGDIALQQRDTLLVSTGLMLLIIVPVMILTAFFGWKYRADNKKVEYAPDWDHSTSLELVIWSAPLLIIIALGALTWLSTHLLDPYRPVSRLSKSDMITRNMEPLTVDVVALDWKWLFFYPQYDIATVNEVAAPVNRPIIFHITSATVMNAFYIPALAGQIYAMAGMQTRLWAVINSAGTYKGFSSNYSGDGFSGMQFEFYGMPAKNFDAWVAKVRKNGTDLSRSAYMALAKPSENVAPVYYKSYMRGLYKDILNMCVIPGKMCLDTMAGIDDQGGLDQKNAADNLAPAATAGYEEHPSALGPVKTYVINASSVPAGAAGYEKPVSLAPTAPPHPLSGANLPQPRIAQPAEVR